MAGIVLKGHIKTNSNHSTLLFSSISLRSIHNFMLTFELTYPSAAFVAWRAGPNPNLYLQLVEYSFTDNFPTSLHNIDNFILKAWNSKKDGHWLNVEMWNYIETDDCISFVSQTSLLCCWGDCVCPTETIFTVATIFLCITNPSVLLSYALCF